LFIHNVVRYWWSGYLLIYFSSQIQIIVIWASVLVLAMGLIAQIELPPKAEDETAILGSLKSQFGGDEPLPLVAKATLLLNSTALPLSFYPILDMLLSSIPGARYLSLQRPLLQDVNFNGVDDTMGQLKATFAGTAALFIASFIIGRLPFRGKQALWGYCIGCMGPLWTWFHFRFKIGTAEPCGIYPQDECPIYKAFDWHDNDVLQCQWSEYPVLPGLCLWYPELESCAPWVTAAMQTAFTVGVLLPASTVAAFLVGKLRDLIASRIGMFRVGRGTDEYERVTGDPLLGNEETGNLAAGVDVEDPGLHGLVDDRAELGLHGIVDDLRHVALAATDGAQLVAKEAKQTVQSVAEQVKEKTRDYCSPTGPPRSLAPLLPESSSTFVELGKDEKKVTICEGTLHLEDGHYSP
jgi:hypothetical protein